MSRKATPPHLLRVTRPVLEFAQLVAALRQDGRRAGWLEWSPDKSPSKPPAHPADLLLRSVVVDAEQTVATKKRHGAPVLRDILREHFRGSTLVLVFAESEVPQIDALLLEPLPLPSDPPSSDDPSAVRWRLQLADGTSRELSTLALVAALRRPHPFAKERT